jgi:hypothetical protein
MRNGKTKQRVMKRRLIAGEKEKKRSNGRQRNMNNRR